MAGTAGSDKHIRPALIIAGPTCSGKSALALALALRFGGTVINADAMQVYRELRVLTARPTPADEAAAPHALYGVRPAAEAGSAAWWRGQALVAMAAAACPILCGGTGLYFRTLTHGLADIPDPGEAARTEARALLAQIGAPALHARLNEADPATAAGLRATDGQRVARAWEVWRGTGRGLSDWQQAPVQSGGATPAPYRFATVLLDPPRDGLRAAIAVRFDAMLRQGALAEAAALLAQNLDPALPAMQAHGVPELAAFCRGEIMLGMARQRAVLATGQYAKRQATWFHRQSMADPSLTHTIHSQFTSLEQLSESFMAKLDQFMYQRG